jgi:hypothetical protein
MVLILTKLLKLMWLSSGELDSKMIMNGNKKEIFGSRQSECVDTMPVLIWRDWGKSWQPQ